MADAYTKRILLLNGDYCRGGASCAQHPRDMQPANDREREFAQQMFNEWRKYYRRTTGSRGIAEQIRRSNAATEHPELLPAWHPTLNGDVTLYDLRSTDRDFPAMWACLANNTHEPWKASVLTRANMNSGCPTCAGHRIDESNHIFIIYPHMDAAWDEQTNTKPKHEVRMSDVELYNWICPRVNHHTRQRPKSYRDTGCYPCARNMSYLSTVGNSMDGHRELKRTIADRFDEYATYWDWEKNYYLPSELSYGTETKTWWRCEFGHSFKKTFADILEGSFCPECSNRVVTSDNCLSVTHPMLAELLDVEETGFPAEEVVAGSGLWGFWDCNTGDPHHVHRMQFYQKLRMVERGSNNTFGCPYCNNILLCPTNSLSHLFPDIAPEFDRVKNGKGPEDIKGHTNEDVHWQCPNGHSWHCAVSDRVDKGRECDQCSIHGTSLIERRLHEFLEASNLFATVAPGNQQVLSVPWRTNRFARVDILLTTVDGKQVVVEYDGSNWHDTLDRIERDLLKTEALLAAGYHVIRVREQPLPKLVMKHPHLNQIPYKVSYRRRDLEQLVRKIYRVLT